MKSVKLFALLPALMVIVVFAGCKSSAKAAPGISLESTAKVETVEHKGTAFGIKDIPPWLSEFVQRNGTRSVEALPDYSRLKPGPKTLTPSSRSAPPSKPAWRLCSRPMKTCCPETLTRNANMTMLLTRW